MIRQSYRLEIITPCFCAGANQDEAEIRAASIRGQLRWWFRVLGGFESLAPMPIREQEAELFGAAAGEEGTAGALAVRVDARDLKSQKKDGQLLGHANFSDPAFLTFPIQSREKQGQKTSDASRGVIESGDFELMLLCRDSKLGADDLEALITCFGNLASLGYRSRRAMGALAFAGRSPMALRDALPRFRTPDNLLIKSLPAKSSKNAIATLGRWLKSCRSHGRSGNNDTERKSPYFPFAKNDHDIGYDTPSSRGTPAYRPALGLPIIQRTRNETRNWEWEWEDGRARGRFASPVLLRPHKDERGGWHALVIFVEARKWPDGKKVHLDGQPRSVSLDLYEAMKNDSQLTDFV